LKKKLLIIIFVWLIAIGITFQFFPFAELLNNYEIPVDAEETVNSVNPDYIFDTGDVTESSAREEYKAYSEWVDNLEGETFAIQGGHDREHRKGDPYGTGFFTEGDFNSPTQVLKMGNMVFILISEDRYYYNNGNIWLHHITPQLHNWIENKIEKYSTENNNIFIMEHCPPHNTVAWSDGHWWATSDTPWANSSKRLKETIEDHENHIVAHISGHIHTKDNWRDVPKDKTIYGFGDWDKGIENVGHFVNGGKKEWLPDTYFLNPQALCYTHGSASSLKSSPIYYFDLLNGENEFMIKTKNIKTEKITRTYPINTEYPIELEDGLMNFIESKTTIKSKTNATILENKWLKVDKDSSIVFHRKWNTSVDDTSIQIEPENLDYDTEYLKEKEDEVLIKVDFQEKAEIDNVKILPDKSKIIEDDPTAENRRIVLLTDIHFDTPKNGHKYGGVKIDTGDKILEKLPLISPETPARLANKTPILNRFI